MPKVSVIIPSYNHAHYIARSVESVLTQTLGDLELIVVDDGSTDNSRDVLHSLHDSRLRVLEQTNQGAHAAINRGLAEAKGEFLAILNSDDEYRPERLTKLIPVLAANPNIGLAASYIEVIDQNGKVSGTKEGYKNLEPWPLEPGVQSFRNGADLRAALLTENYLATTSNYVFSHTWLDLVGGFRPLRFVHDWDFALRIAAQGELFLYPEPLMRYRVHATNTIRQNQAAMIFEICWILAVHLPRHVSDPWFKLSEDPTQLGRLYHSIYTFGCDRVLSIMLLQRLSEDSSLAEALLQPDHPQRATYLDLIGKRLMKNGSSSPQQTRDGLRNLLIKFKRWMP
jgi:glycosyltransferase involved in cell wall biosynthesis